MMGCGHSVPCVRVHVRLCINTRVCVRIRAYTCVYVRVCVYESHPRSRGENPILIKFTSAVSVYSYYNTYAGVVPRARLPLRLLGNRITTDSSCAVAAGTFLFSPPPCIRRGVYGETAVNVIIFSSRNTTTCCTVVLLACSPCSRTFDFLNILRKTHLHNARERRNNFFFFSLLVLFKLGTPFFVMEKIQRFLYGCTRVFIGRPANEKSVCIIKTDITITYTTTVVVVVDHGSMCIFRLSK